MVYKFGTPNLQVQDPYGTSRGLEVETRGLAAIDRSGMSSASPQTAVWSSARFIWNNWWAGKGFMVRVFISGQAQAP